MYDSYSSKIKNDKIMRWRVKLSSYKYDIVYRPGKDNKGADTFSRIQCSAISSNALKELHNSTLSPGNYKNVTHCQDKKFTILNG